LAHPEPKSFRSRKEIGSTRGTSCGAPMKHIHRTAWGDFRRLREDVKLRLSKLSQDRSSGFDSVLGSEGTAPLVTTMGHVPSRLGASDRVAKDSSSAGLANRLVSSSIRLAPKGRVNRYRSDCRDSNSGIGECGQRVSPPCVAWGTEACRRSALGVALVGDQLSQ